MAGLCHQFGISRKAGYKVLTSPPGAAAHGPPIAVTHECLADLLDALFEAGLSGTPRL
jgi:hypothetical protein